MPENTLDALPSLSSPPSTLPAPLAGVRVLAQAIVWAGPYATLMLADLGAEVIEVESIQHLNPTRTTIRRPPASWMEGPRGALYYNRDASEGFWNRQAYFNYGKRGHKSVTLDITRREGKELLFDLVRTSDVFIENNAAGVAERWGIDYPALAEINPALIMVRFPGYGLDGPYKHFKGYGANVEAVVGHTMLRGYRDSDPSRTPAIFHADPNAGAHVAFAVMAALLAREERGAGQLVDLSQAEAVIHHLAHAFMDYSMNRRVQDHWGNRHPSMAPYGVFPCRPHPPGPPPLAGEGGGAPRSLAQPPDSRLDSPPPRGEGSGVGSAGERAISPPLRGEGSGVRSTADTWLALAVPSDEAFVALCEVMGRSEIARDPRFRDAVSRHHHQDELEPIISAWTSRFSARDLMHRLQAAGVPATEVMHQPDLRDDPHLTARGFWASIDHPDTGTHRYPGALAHFGVRPIDNHRAAPRLGEHNAEILSDLLGIDALRYERLRNEQIIGEAYLETAR